MNRMKNVCVINGNMNMRKLVKGLWLEFMVLRMFKDAWNSWKYEKVGRSIILFYQRYEDLLE